MITVLATTRIARRDWILIKPGGGEIFRREIAYLAKLIEEDT